jgi:acyl-CoA thioester hydrolase
MDMLGHVNNVTYVDYLQEARVDMLWTHPPAAGGEALAEGVVVVRHEVKHLAPLVFRREPVNIEIWVSEIRAATFTLAYEIFDETAEGRRVYLQARSVLTPYVFATERPRRLGDEEREVLSRFLEPGMEPLPVTVQVAEPVPPARRHSYECFVRFSDVDAYRHVNNVKYFEYYQEARIALVDVLGRFEHDDQLSVVVAQTDVDYRTPMLLRVEPYVVDTWVTSVGTSSFVFGAEIRYADTVISRGRMVLVSFDPSTNRAVPLSETHRARLLATELR